MLKSYRYNRYSQNGEDGLIEEIFSRLGITGGFVVEFGAADGLWLSNSARWWKDEADNFKALLIEPREEAYGELLKNIGPNAVAQNRFVSPDKDSDDFLEKIFAEVGVPKDLELLSIDVDSCDYAIWESLQGWNPKVVIVEGNSGFGAHTLHVSLDNGSSAASLVELGARKGYSLAAHCGNCIFVRNDLFPHLGMGNHSLAQLWDY